MSFLIPSFNAVEVRLSADIDPSEAIFPLHRAIDQQYRALSWPGQIREIVVLTQVCCGLGDISAAAKAIAVMQRICPDLTFDWILPGAPPLSRCDPLSLLHCDDPSKVRVRDGCSQPPENSPPGELLLAGPVRYKWKIDYTEAKIQRKIAGPVFAFMENAEELSDCNFDIFQMRVGKALPEISNDQIHQTLHSIAFPSKSSNMYGLLPMGLQPGSGVFLDRSRLEAPLSRGYYCFSYLRQIQDIELRKDILESMNVFDDLSQPEYEQYSFNSGYAHHSASWGKFIDCVAIHEKNKHAVIVLNQHGEFEHPSTQEFQDLIFTAERLAFLKEKGYETVVFKGGKQEVSFLQKADDPQVGRRLTVIIRCSFAPNDMKCMQLASERLLATGDNSAVESWCARCKLYLYEDVANKGCKWRFLQQQVDLAQGISPNLSKLLAFFGGDNRGRNNDRCLKNEPLDNQKMTELEELLNDPNLGDATLQFCHQITANYSFCEVFEAALKRTAWHNCIPELAKIEAETIDEDFRLGLIDHLRNREEKTFQVRNLPELGKRVQEAVQKYLSQDIK